MLKNIIFVLIIFLCSPYVVAKEIPVKIKPITKITTANTNLQEGDNVNFEVVDDVLVNSHIYFKKGAEVVGEITSIEDNDYLYTPAKLYIEDFKARNTDGNMIKMNGAIFKAGNDHSWLTQFIPLPFVYLRGGEVQIKPKEDIFILFLKESDN